MPTKDPRYDTPAWRAVRLVVMDRDKWVCQIRQRGCTYRATDVDHIQAAVEGGEFYDLSNLRASCRGCNARAGAKVATARRARYRYRTTVAPTETRF
jgi:5-methylcytosine-specific restriction endonuclease McrA